MGTENLPVAEIVRPFEVETPGGRVDPLPTAEAVTDIEGGDPAEDTEDAWDLAFGPEVQLGCSQATTAGVCGCAALLLLLLIVLS